MTGAGTQYGRNKVVRNERRKLLATTFNTIGLAILGLGALQPLFTDAVPGLLRALVSSTTFVGLHALAHLGLADLEE